MSIFGRILLKSLAILYLLMAIIGLLGYFQIEKFSTSIFSFFYTILGTYSLILPALCLLFAVVCWKISKKSNQEEDDDEDEDDGEQAGYTELNKRNNMRNNTRDKNDISRERTGKERPTRERGRRERPTNERTGKEGTRFSSNTTKLNDYGFSSYFADRLPVKENQTSDKDYKSLGTNFSTYFGQGEKNIYLPSKTVSLNGFKDYFKDQNLNMTFYEQAVNDNVSRDEYVGRESYISRDYVNSNMTIGTAMGSKKQLYPPVTAEKSYKSDKLTTQDIKKIKEIMEREQLATTQTAAAAQAAATAQVAVQNVNNQLAVKKWRLPGLDLLNSSKGTDPSNENYNPKRIEDVLSTFGVTAKVVNITTGPVITRYELSPAPGTKINKIVNLSDDLALALASKEIRIEAPIPGKAAIGIEIPRLKPCTVFFREIIDSPNFNNNSGKLKVGLGKDIANNVVVAELEKMPHLLVAGATGSGKSIFINCLINSLLYTVTPDEVKLLLIDPKMVELNQYNGIPHLLAPVVTDPKKASKYLKYIVTEMESRYELFVTNGVRDLDHYNKTNSSNPLPHIVVIIDELADLMMVASNEMEEYICRIAQMARAAGIHLVLATQRPSVNVITGLIKANIPSRISFAVSSQIDSRTILDSSGAEKLLGKGDMLYAPIGLNKPARVHGCYIDEQETRNVIEHWKRQSEPDYKISEEQLIESTVPEQQEELDERFKEAGQLVIASGVASVSFLQRRLRVGYSRAARLMDMLEEAGVVGSYEGNKPRDIIMSLENFNATY